jgi:hypothetical protein
MESDLDLGAYLPGCGCTAAPLEEQNGGCKAENGGKKPCKYGAITKVQEFVLERDFIKHTTYAKWSEEDDIPFWAMMPLHLEYLLKDEDIFEHILAFMYVQSNSKEFWGKQPFTIRIPGLIPRLVIGKSLQES